MPARYVIKPEGVYLIAKEEDSIRLTHLTDIPFFIAEKTEPGKILLIRYLNGSWLREWLAARAIIARRTYFDLMIFPTECGNIKNIINYALSSLIAAPYVHTSDATLLSVLASITEQHYLDPGADYPVLVNVSNIKAICDVHEMKYNTVRTWLSRHDIIEHDANICRNKITGKPTRFLVFKKPLRGYL